MNAFRQKQVSKDVAGGDALAGAYRLLGPESILVWVLALAAWGLMLAATLTGQRHFLVHGVLMMDSTVPWLLKLILFLVAWQVMMIAMMLPTTLPMIQTLVSTVSSQSHTRFKLLLFLAAYAVIWSGFALFVFWGDMGVHRFAADYPWSQTRSWLFSGLILLFAGVFQFTSWKEICRKQCQAPEAFISRRHQYSIWSVWNLGLEGGLYSLGCCWPLMLLMFATGFGSLPGMLGLTGIMLLEKTSQIGIKMAPIVGCLLITCGFFELSPWG